VLEAVLRMARLGAIATPTSIAEEAILHSDDVDESITYLVGAGYLDRISVVSDDGVPTTIISPSPGLQNLLRAAPRATNVNVEAPAPSGPYETLR